MARGNAIDFSGERFALLAFFNKKGNETTLETFNYILEFWLLFHNFNFVYGLCYGYVVIKRLEKSNRLESQERHVMQASDLVKR